MERIDIFNLPQEVINKIPVGITKCELLTDENNRIYDFKFINANSFMKEITGFESYELYNKTITELFPNVKDSIFDWITILGEIALTSGLKHIEQYVDIFGKFLSIEIISLDKNQFYLVLNDITEKRNFRKNIIEKESEIDFIDLELRKKANIDSMTLVYNYQFIMKILKEEVEMSSLENRNLSAALLDIDDFTYINKIYGNETGDNVLKETAVALKNSMRKIDSLGRTGGDEFLLVLTNVDIDIAKIVIERMKVQMNIDIKAIDNIKITFSGAVLEYEGETYEEFYHKLREKLIKAKSIGKNIIVF